MLVTGGAGFIGSHIVEQALDTGWSVRIADSFRPDVHGEATLRLPPHPGLEIVRCDLAEGVPSGLLDGIDVVVHQAAKVGLGVDFSDAHDYMSSNVVATAHVLSAMRQAGVSRFVFASSMVVYGDGAYRDEHGPVRPLPRTRDDLAAGRFEPVSPRTGAVVEPELVTEDASLEPQNAYAISKLSSEQLAHVWARETGGSAALLRYHNVYGPHMPMSTPYAGVASLFRSALERSVAPRVFEDGGQRRDFVHVRDVAAANLAAVEWTATHPGTARAFNIGSGVVTTVGTMAAVLAHEFGGPSPVVTGEYRLGDVRHVTASSARARAELAWRPHVPFAEGMREFATAPLRPPVVPRAATP